MRYIKDVLQNSLNSAGHLLLTNDCRILLWRVGGMRGDRNCWNDDRLIAHMYPPLSDDYWDRRVFPLLEPEWLELPQSYLPYMTPFQLKYNISATKIDVKSSANAKKHMTIEVLIKLTLRLFSMRLDCQALSSVST